jgi:hypothetical protein
MPQKTNLNVYPYFDDFNPDNIYHKVLFKPGYPIQARELNVIQSILQNQVEQFGKWAFQEGSPVIPGSITYNDRYYAVELKNNFNGIDVFEYIESLIGKTVRGQISGVRARILSVISSTVSIRNNVTIYVTYLDSDYATSEYRGFSDSENILIEEDITAYLSVDPDTILKLQANEAFATTIDSQCNSVGSQVSVESGVYYVRGYFVKNTPQYIILDQYQNNPSYKIGFTVVEDIITSESDESLNDNANGFLNYAAPGADRFGLSLILSKVALDEDIPESFVQLLEVRDGIVRSIKQDPRLNELGKELARRTYDESGDYYVKSPTIVTKETLDNFLGNEGIYNPNQITFSGNVPTENLGTYQISPLKAYVKGYEIETLSPIFLDFEKARSTKRIENQNIVYNTASTFSLNRVFGSPKIGFSTDTISLRNDRVGTISGQITGKEIGLARVYDFSLESGSYNTLVPDANEWDVCLYDIQTYSEIQVNENLTLNVPAYIKGKSSGATAFLKFAASNSGILTAYNINGTFINGEKLIFNDIEDDKTRISTSIRNYTLDDVKSVYGLVGVAGTFTGDIIKTQKINFGIVDISPQFAGLSTVSSNIPQFSGVINVGDLVSYTEQGKLYPTYSKVTSVTATTLTLSGITSVTGVCDGGLPNSNISVSDFKLLATKSILSVDNNLYTKLPKENISNVDLSNSVLIIRKQFDVTITSNSTGNITADVDEKFLPFDEERYVLVTETGITQKLTSDMFDVSVYNSSGGTTIKFNGLTTSSGSAKLIATLNKNNVKEKKKDNSIVKSIVVDKSRLVGSGIGETTLNNGLTYGNYPYGTRVEDDEICLLQSDVNLIYGIFEQSDSSNLNLDPNCPRIILSNLSGASSSTNDLVLGETFIGQVSNAIAICVEKINSNTIGFTYLNDNTFVNGESVLFQTTSVEAIVNSVSDGDKDILSNYILDDGQRSTIYDYSRIIRKSQYNEPIRKIKIYFGASSYSNSDVGDITTVNSYQAFNYSQIPSVNNIRNSDLIDIRPKVSSYIVAENKKSPFEFDSRDFSSSYNNSSKYILASDESISCSYSFYLPRIDKILLSKNGLFQVRTGDPAEVPQPPLDLDDSIELASVFVPAYTFSVDSISIEKKEYKRYTMSDIGKLENRIENLEYYTTLSLLEKETAELNVLDNNGNPRFKSGFFVDNFTTTVYQQKDTIVKNSIDISNNILRPSHYTTNCDLIIGQSSIILDKNNAVDVNYSNDFISTNIKKTGNVVTLDYIEVVENTQPYSTRVVDVTSYSTSENPGSIILNPSSDTWVSQQKLKPNKIELDGDITESQTQVEVTEDSEDTGFLPIVWRGWSKYWNYRDSFAYSPYSSYPIYSQYPHKYKKTTGIAYISSNTTSNIRTVTNSNSTISLPETSIGESVVSNDVIPYMRSRNIEFKAERLKPFTRMYAFFDNVDVNSNIVPKLIEIEMVSGTFQASEVVTGRTLQAYNSWISNKSQNVPLLKDRFDDVNIPIQDLASIKRYSVGISTNINNDTFRTLDNFSTNRKGLARNSIRFRLCTPNHKVGPYDSPTKIYNANPYDRSQVLPSSYSTNSTILNVDTYSLSYSGISEFFGKIHVGMRLVGMTSGAIAIVKNIRLITDEVGSLIGSFRIPNKSNEKRFTAGEKVFKLTNSSANSLVPGIVFCSAEEKFYSQGFLNQKQENILSTSKPRVAPEVPSEPPPNNPEIPTYNPVASTPYYSNNIPSPKPVSVTPQSTPTAQSTPIAQSTPTAPRIVSVNGGGAVYAKAAQNRLVQAYLELHPGSNVKTVEQVANRLNVKNVDPLASGNLSQNDGDRILKKLQSAGATNYVPGPGSANSKVLPKSPPPPPPTPSNPPKASSTSKPAKKK